MNPDLTRLFIALAVIATALMLYQLVNRLILSRAARLPLAAAFARQGKPTLLYFTTPACIPCRTVQRPAIERLKQLAGDRLQVIEINAESQPDLARQWGVLSVPTTFVLDAQGHPRHVNHGVTPVDKLLHEFEIN